MRKILLPFAMTGLLAMPLVGCDVEEGDAPGDTTNPTDTGDTTQPDTTPSVSYSAIIVDDDGIFQNHRTGNPCATSSVGAHGADIDAVGLFEANGELVGYFDTVQAKLGTTCTIGEAYKDPTQARGAPNGTLTTNFVSLGGGAIIGEFGVDTETGDSLELLAGDVVTVYEIGDKFCTGAGCVGDEGYHVYMATDLTCLNSSNRSACQKRVTGADGAEGEASITLSGF